MPKHLRDIVGKPDWARSKTTTEYVRRIPVDRVTDGDRGTVQNAVFQATNVSAFDRVAHRMGYNPETSSDDGLTEANSPHTARIKTKYHGDRARSHEAWAPFATDNKGKVRRAPSSSMTDAHLAKRHRQAERAARKIGYGWPVDEGRSIGRDVRKSRIVKSDDGTVMMSYPPQIKVGGKNLTLGRDVETEWDKHGPHYVMKKKKKGS